MILTIWLEIHIKLDSKNKMFCQCKNEQDFDTLLPNFHVCPVCTWQPWALPTLSEDVLWLSLKLWKTLNCKINKESKFDRKSYFYPDLPMWYQITQLYKPTNVDGEVKFFVNNYEKERSVRIIDAHMESDTAKMIHNGWEALIDFNRAWTPLVEIVTWPDFGDNEEVVEFLKELQRIIRYNKISNADMEKWQMRVDVNISIREKESDKLWTRVELKNINSFGMIKRAINHEYNRQVEILKKWWKIDQSTRMRNDMEWESKLMRSKEDALDYRYFPEPDLPVLKLENWIIEELKNTELTIQHDIIKKFKQEYGFHKEYINALINDQSVLQYFLSCFDKISNAFSHSEQSEESIAKTVAKRISWQINAYLKENIKLISELPFDQQKFIDFLKISIEWKIMDNQMKDVMAEMLSSWKDPQKIIKEKWFDTPGVNNNELKSIIKKVLETNPNIVEQYKWGKTTTLWFFVGQVMKETWWKANPKMVGEIVAKILG